MLTPSRSARLENIFIGDGEYDLCLRIGELITLQEKTNAGPQHLFNRISSNQWLVEDITETIRLALIGGGLSHQQAHTLVKSYIKEGYLFDYVHAAHAVLSAALIGVEDEPVEEEGDENPPMAPSIQMEDSDGALSSNSEPQSDLPPLT